MRTSWTKHTCAVAASYYALDKVFLACQGLLGAEEAAWVLRWEHRPMALAQLLSACVAAVHVTPRQRTTVDEAIVDYVRLMGACERIEYALPAIALCSAPISCWLPPRSGSRSSLCSRPALMTKT